jgi:diguanylate cyclase (GGDEF)-like protein
MVRAGHSEGRVTANLLIVDDNREHLDLLTAMLQEGEHYRIFEALSGEQALEVMSAEDIHVVLLDVVMPDMDGYEVCRQIRKRYAAKPIQVVMISGFDHGSDLNELLDLGADDFISKPVTALELQARIRAAVIRLRSQTHLFGSFELPQQPKGNGRKQDLFSLRTENFQLRREYQKIRRVNEELQRSCHQLELLASMDALSGLLNRRTLFQRLDVEIERSVRLGLPLTGIMIDIDHFKRVNDNHGHQCGDIIIREIGAKLTRTLRKYDYAGRYGGEEFFVIFSNTNAETARTIAERFRKDMEDTRFSWNEESVQVTVSVGIAQYSPGENPDRWISRADAAMYRAKEMGRNRVVGG